MEGEGHSLLHLEVGRSDNCIVSLILKGWEIGQKAEGPAGKAVKGEDGRHYCCAKTVARYKR